MKTYTSKESELLCVKSSKIHGVGVFARFIIPKDTFLIEYTGEKILTSEGLTRDKIQKSKGKFYVFALNSKWCIDGSTGGDARFINHSCSPNCRYQRKNGKIWIRALRKISVGEELTYDYADSEKGTNLCKCRAENCKGSM
ncbi:MAG: SET domain-containing protein-lysine N-methyltransferase [Candidatus Woesearchaeota archaeon]|nr:SET domain-containing protein-lysine N-methyltransferase [Candidatus Woesearchaeota archaeon]